ncbi:Signal transducer regulating beta-lactamase production, contains metallopeptidase domain [Deinococcus reticulitermitis]|uniref:Signal transducer regulating beta-lactamase production, contains metallopeptidase domain n=1 Tax=Deinococcus reticulitermitis TaxID=856736 RepID=A0A1H7CHI5_9DEIO|nr:M56 family metallopeptidase [Deinococcus reticulitermitis]SEJ85155.1 Signal transducer regulating beta-lactamase production, contains metallopeptidase domain [Deinococcus reticulitermitis]
MTEWLLTYLLHSTLVLSPVLLLVNVFTPAAALRDRLLRLALCLPVGTALLSVSVFSPPRVVGLMTAAAPTRAPERAPTTLAPQRLDGAVARPGASTHAAIPLPLSKPGVPWALILLLGSAGWTVVRYGLAWRHLPLRSARPSDDPALQRILGDVARHAPLRHVRLLQGPVAGPCALGRHTILIPPDLTNHLTHQQLNAVVAHEYAHLLRRDPAWTVALGALTHLLWFQPLNWMVLAAWRRASEEACDAWAARTVSPTHLAHALLRLAQPASRPAHALLSPSASTSHLTVRITAWNDPLGADQEAKHFAPVSP